MALLFKSISMALMHYFKQEPNGYPDLKPAEMIEFKNSLSEDEQAAAKKELESYGYEFEGA